MCSTRVTEQPGWWGGGPVILRFAGFIAATLTLVACGEVQAPAVYEPTTDPKRLFMALTLDHRAINLSTVAPYDTFRLVATPRNALGERMDGLPQPTFRSSDTTRVWVGADGLLQARRAASEVLVIAEVVTEDNIRRADTARVNVITTHPPEIGVFSIAPETPEEAIRFMIPDAARIYVLPFLFAGIDMLRSQPLRVFDTSGSPIFGLAVEYRSLDPAIIVIQEEGIGIPTQPGEARIEARTVAYGVVKADTATYTVPPAPLLHVVIMEERAGGDLTLGPEEVTIYKGGYVLWHNRTKTPLDIEFERPDDVAELPPMVCLLLGACGWGDIEPFAVDPSSDGTDFFEALRGRSFPIPGVYEYRSPLTGRRGRVVVVDDAPAAGRTEDRR